MRKLNRALALAPRCLDRFVATDTWDDVTSDEQLEIRASLETFQGHRCAYCEANLDAQSKQPHIEHFEQRSRVPAKTFQWTTSSGRAPPKIIAGS